MKLIIGLKLGMQEWQINYTRRMLRYAARFHWKIQKKIQKKNSKNLFLIKKKFKCFFLISKKNFTKKISKKIQNFLETFRGYLSSTANSFQSCRTDWTVETQIKKS
jgi:hypothetical protein